MRLLPLGPLLHGALAVMLALAGQAEARQGAAPASATQGFQAQSLAHVPVLALPPTDRSRLLAEDDLRASVGPGPLRFAAPIDVLATPETDGAWETLLDGSRLWRLRVSVPGATDLNFGFSRFALPHGATLHVLAEALPAYEGPYDAADAIDGQLWTPIIPGDRAVLELRVPPRAKAAPSLMLARVGAGYRDLLHVLNPGVMPASGPCNVDVVCSPQGDPWRDQIRSVALLSIDGTEACTGTMIMDVPQDFRPFLLTAEHCLIDAINDATIVAYWNYQASACGGPRDGFTFQNQTGATLRASSAPSDFTLVEMANAPNPAFNVYWSGWDRSDAIPAGSVGIHHPSTDEKAITFNLDPLEYGVNCLPFSGPDLTHWYISEYEEGTTEGGSSGSGLWDPTTRLLVGTLTGGAASCSVADYDCYGRFAQHWTGGLSPTTRLSNWLDPAEGAPTFVQGSFPSARARLFSVAPSDSCAFGGGGGNGVVEPGETIELRVSLAATGSLSGVTGSLTALSGGVTLVDGQATWPDMVASAPVVSDAPHLTISVDGSVGCYGRLDFRLDVTASEGGPFPIPFSVEVGAPPPSDAPMPILDRTTITSTMTIAQDVTISGLRVPVRIDHSFVGDLRIDLESPAGTLVTLLDQPGDTTIPGGCGGVDMDVVFDDASAVIPEEHCQATSPWLWGAAQPFTSLFPPRFLSAFDGESTLGTWQLHVTDVATDDTGILVDWDLLTTPRLQGACVACTSGCPGQEISIADVRVSKAAAGAVNIFFTGRQSPCATGEQVRVAFSARPAAPPGSFPVDPAFTNVTPQDRDPAPLVFRHVPPPFPGALPATWFYQIVEALPGGQAGPSGSYGN